MFKGIKLLKNITGLFLLFETLHLINFIHGGVQGAAIGAIAMTIYIGSRAVYADETFMRRHWAYIAYMLVIEVALGLNGIVPNIVYIGALFALLLMSLTGLMCIDAPSIRKHLTEMDYTLKNACYNLIAALTIAIADVAIDPLLSVM